jgi:hypothetical protein
MHELVRWEHPLLLGNEIIYSIMQLLWNRKQNGGCMK